MKAIVKTIALSKLRKLEIPQFANEVIGIVEKHDHEILKFKETFDTLKGLKPLLVNLEEEYGPHPLTVKMDKAHARRLKYATLITSQMKVYIKADKEAMRGNVELTGAEVMRTLQKLSRDSNRRVNEKINQFFYRVDASEQLEEAYAALNLMEYLDELRAANSSFTQMWTTRNASITSRPKAFISPIAKEVNAALRNLFNQINLLQARNPEFDYTSLINELNGALASFEGIIRTRKTYNKKRTDAAIDGQEVMTTNFVIKDASELPKPPARYFASTNGVNPENVEQVIEGTENGNLIPLSTQINAAMSNVKNKPGIDSSKG